MPPSPYLYFFISMILCIVYGIACLAFMISSKNRFCRKALVFYFIAILFVSYQNILFSNEASSEEYDFLLYYAQQDKSSALFKKDVYMAMDDQMITHLEFARIYWKYSFEDRETDEDIKRNKHKKALNKLRNNFLL